MLIHDQPLIRNYLYLITCYHTVLALMPGTTSDMRVHTRGGGARGQNLEHLKIIFFLLFFLV